MSFVRRVAFFAVVLIAWWVTSATCRSNTLIPSPTAVLASLAKAMSSGALLRAVSFSLRRLLVGYSLSLVVGVPVGALLGRSRLADETMGSLVAGLQALPSICWLPLSLLWFGLNDRAIVFVVVMGSLVSIIVAVRDGVRNLPPQFVRAGRTLGSSGFDLFHRVLLPASLPSIIGAAKLGWSFAWRALMSGELLFATVGLGRLLMLGRDLADMSQVIAVMLVIVAIGMFSDIVIFGSLERHMRRSWGLDLA